MFQLSGFHYIGLFEGANSLRRKGPCISIVYTWPLQVFPYADFGLYRYLEPWGKDD